MQPGRIVPVHQDAPTEDEVLRQIAPAVGQPDFRHWFDSQVSISVVEDQLTIGVKSPFVQNWMQRRFRQPLTRVATDLLGPSATVWFEVDANLSLKLPTTEHADHDPNTQASDEAAPLEQAARSQNRIAATGSSAERRQSGPVKRQLASLAEFVTGECNRLAFVAAQQVVTTPGLQFNPLFVYGNVGIGKTHLLDGIFREVRQRYPSLKIVHLTAEMFGNYFTEALKQRNLPSFRQRFRSVDLLIVDDVDFFDGKRVMQEEFLHTFKHLESQGCQIVLSADRHPRLLTKLSEELTSRFMSGVVCRIESPDLETRREIVERKASRLTGRFAPEVLDYIASRFPHNVREIEGALNYLQAYYSMTNKRVTVTAARRILSELERDCIRIVSLAEIESTVCDFFGIEPAELRSEKRTRTLSQPRMLAMYLARKHTEAAYSEIGHYFGGRNHSTVMSAEKKVRRLIEEESDLAIASRSWQVADLVNSLEQQLLAG